MDYLKKAVGRMLKSVSSMTKGEMKMKNKMIALVAVMMLLAGSAFAATDTDTINVLVTPVVAAGIEITEAAYDFGSVAVNTSSGAVTACLLTNSGTVGVTLQKEIYGNPAGWTAAIDGGQTADTYVLHVATAATQPAFASLNTACAFGTLNTITTLTDAAGLGGGVMPVDGTANLWFAIDMPSSSLTSTQKTIQVRIIATNN